jgi:hypothetical protein
MMPRKFYQTAYREVRPGSATLAKTSTSTLAAPARNSARVAALDRDGRGQHGGRKT